MSEMSAIVSGTLLYSCLKISVISFSQLGLPCALLWLMFLNIGINSESTSSYFNGFFRRFALPPGTFIIFTPELTLPAWRDRVSLRKRSDENNCDINSKEGVIDNDNDEVAFKNSDIQISSPFYVYFDKLGFTHEDSLFNAPSHVAPFVQEWVVNPSLNILGIPPRSQGRDTRRNSKADHNSSKKRTSQVGDSQRLKVFRKIENLFDELGLDGRTCLLRAICELHEFPFESGRMGLFGEVLFEIFGKISESDEDGQGRIYGTSCLSTYITAEKYGKNRNCQLYAKHCNFSIFQWYWSWEAPMKKMLKST